ncbi:MAG: hypothetical protein V9G98_09670 [Candidatus Competibacter sp.]
MVGGGVGVKNPETGEEVPLKPGNRFEVVPGGGLLPSPVPFNVEVDGEQKVGIIMGLNVEEVEPPGESQDNQLIYWYKEMGQ